jgi:hypothetical protein
MRVIIAGSRDVTDYEMVLYCVNMSGFQITEVVSGDAPGVDQLGIRYAWKNKLELYRFPADWETHGKAAGPIRNQEMADNADALIAIRKNLSRGTTDMINRAKAKGLRVYVKDI